MEYGDFFEGTYESLNDEALEKGLKEMFMRFGAEIPPFDAKCPGGASCPCCEGAGFFVSDYGKYKGTEVVCSYIDSDDIPVWMWRLRQMVESDAWKIWSMEGIVDGKFWKRIPMKSDLEQEVLASEAKFGIGSVIVGNLSSTNDRFLFIKNPAWKLAKETQNNG